MQPWRQYRRKDPAPQRRRCPEWYAEDEDAQPAKEQCSSRSHTQRAERCAPSRKVPRPQPAACAIDQGTQNNAEKNPKE